MKSQLCSLLLIMFASIPAFSQACNPPAGKQYDNQVAPWPQSEQVFMSTDAKGTGTNGNVLVDGIEITPDPSNPAPKFTLDTTAGGQQLSQTFINGAMGWNVHGTTNGTCVGFQQGSTLNTGNWIVSPTWPKATVSYLDSNGHSHSTTVDFSGKNGTVAATSYLPDYDALGHPMSTAAAAVTLLNTNGTYTVANAGTFPIFDPTQGSITSAFDQLGKHESAHGFGVDDQHTTDANGTRHNVCGDVMSFWSASVANPGGGTNNNSGCAVDAITNCDDQEIKANPDNLYSQPQSNPPPHHRPCLVDGDPCDCSEDPTGCSPIIIDTGGEGFHLTSVEDGVLFDIRGDGHRIKIAWTAPRYHNAFLVLDRNGDGKIKSGKELFGNFTQQPKSDHPNGFLALSEFDKPENGGNSDEVIDEHDAVFSKLRLWIDENHDGVCQPGELHTLAEFGIYSLSLQYYEARRKDAFGNQFRYRALVNPGERRDYRDRREHEDRGTHEVGRWAYDVFFK